MFSYLGTWQNTSKLFGRIGAGGNGRRGDKESERKESQVWAWRESHSLSDWQSECFFIQSSVGKERFMLFQNTDHILFVPRHVF